MKRVLLFSLAIVATVAVIAGSQSKFANGSESSAPQLIAAGKINDAGSLVRGFNIASVERTGDDANYGVRVTLTNVGSIDNLYPVVTLSDHSVGVVADLTQIAGGPPIIDVGVEHDYTSGFYIAVFRQ
jgi:hypothetical protein